MVSRSREQCPTFLSHDTEQLLKDAMVKFPDIEQDIKSALRDLECNVTLKEEWTGASKVKIVN